jgi:hypothetical protein
MATDPSAAAVINYPGVTNVLSFSVEFGHGILPATHVLECDPTDFAPAATGDVEFGVPGSTITHIDCLYDLVRSERTRSDLTATAYLQDRRWRWQLGPPIDGHYNQLDNHAKLIPRTVRSPFQLAVLCLKAMGEAYPASATATVAGGSLTGVTVFDGGRGHVVAPTVTLIGGGGTGATATAVIAGGVVTGITVGAAGSGYTSAPRVILSPPAGCVIDLPAGLAAPVGPGVPGGSAADTVIDTVAFYLKLGQNLPPTGTNLRVEWGDGLTAAQALAQLCDRFGRTIAPSLRARTTTIIPLGSGTALPDLPAETLSASIDPAAIPANIVVIGAEVPFQTRLLFRAVAEEWDGSHVLLHEASYAPQRPSQAMQCYATGLFNAAGLYKLSINGVDFEADVVADGLANLQAVVDHLRDEINASADVRIDGVVTAATATFIGVPYLSVTGDTHGVEFEFVTSGNVPTWKAQCVKGPVANPDGIPVIFQVAAFGDFNAAHDFTITINGVPYVLRGTNIPTETYRGLFEEFKRVILATGVPEVAGKVTVGVWDTGIEIQALTVDPLTVTATRTPSANPAVVNGVTVTQLRDGVNGKGFEYSVPSAGLYGFANVNPTPRLSWQQAMELASRSVYRRYQLVMVDPGDRSPGVKVPGLYNPADDTTRVYEPTRILLSDTMPEQNAPRGGDVNRVDPTTGQPYAAQFYDGYSRDRQPRAFGMLFAGVTVGGLWTGGGYLGANSTPRSEFYVPFRVIDPLRGIIEFASPVYRILGSAGGATGDVTVHPAGESFGTPGVTCLTIETGVRVLAADTQVPARYLRPLAAGGSGPDQGFAFDEVQVEYRGFYDDRHRLNNWATVDTYGQQLADLLATQILATFQVPTGLIGKYYGIQNGIVLTGQVRQVKHEIGRGGFFTTASQNTEFSRVLPGHAARRRLENLPPDPAQVGSNLASKRNAANNDLRGGRR